MNSSDQNSPTAPETLNFIKLGKDHLAVGELKAAKECFEKACQAEESEGRDPEKTLELPLFLADILTLEGLAKTEQEDPEGFARIEQIVAAAGKPS